MRMQGGRVDFRSIPISKHFRRSGKLWLKTGENAAYCYQYSECRWRYWNDGVFPVNEHQALREVAACWRSKDG